MKSNVMIQKDKKQVIKICKSPKMFKKELYIYEKKLPFTPKLLDHDGKNTLILEYLEGANIGEIEQPDFSQIAELFIELHALENINGKCICHSDNNPKNYILSNGKYFMIDFGEWEYNYPESDIIHFLLYWASIYDSVQFEKAFRQLTDFYLAYGNINPMEWEMSIPEIIENFDNRRERFGKIELNPDIYRNREIMKNIYG
ncbi:MAG: phosphotransferase [Candidatus Cloacimonadales bacterium]|nr:phosphotransferase [Candidatus Cloacimonadales bacterium]